MNPVFVWEPVYNLHRRLLVPVRGVRFDEISFDDCLRGFFSRMRSLHDLYLMDVIDGAEE